jgi:hypothetical protein
VSLGGVPSFAAPATNGSNAQETDVAEGKSSDSPSHGGTRIVIQHRVTGRTSFAQQLKPDRQAAEIQIRIAMMKCCSALRRAEIEVVA